MTLFTELEKIEKMYIEPQKSVNFQSNLEKNEVEGITLSEKNIGRMQAEHLYDINHSNISFFHLLPKAKKAKAKINKWDLIKL